MTKRCENMTNVFIGSPKSSARYHNVKFICVSCVRELRQEYNDNYFYDKSENKLCECCERKTNNILERF